ncbi:hypothetical protein [Streptomyces sp. NPDC057336]|uniref:hypothetical protein n=1 Tax=Streptomyces sp. NPDC057336 TaxID=3346102 RepID=UPI003631BE5E
MDLAELARGARNQAIVAAGAVVVIPLLAWMQHEMQRNLDGEIMSSDTLLTVMLAMLGVALVINMLREWQRVHTPGGRATVARELAEARGRYLLRGDLTQDAWAAVVRAQRAMNLVLASTWLVSPVGTVDRDAFAQGIWVMARTMAKDGSAASGETFAAAIEVYSQRIEEANKIDMVELEARTRPSAGSPSPALAEAVKRADSAGAHALALARL